MEVLVLAFGLGLLLAIMVFFIDGGVQERVLAAANQCGICQKKGKVRKQYILDCDWDGPSVFSYVHEKCLSDVQRNPEKFDQSAIIVAGRIFRMLEENKEDFPQYLARIWGKSLKEIKKDGVFPSS